MFKCDVCNSVAISPVRTVSGTRQRSYKHYVKNDEGRYKLVKTTKGFEITGELNICTKCAGVPEPVTPQHEYFDCNLCSDQYCDGNFVYTRKKGDRNNIRLTRCFKQYRPSKGKFSLFELSMSHPQGLHETLEKLPFQVNLSNYVQTQSRSA